MYDILIKVLFSIVRIISNIFLPIVERVISAISNGTVQLNFSTFSTAIMTLITTATEGGIFMKRILLIPNGLLIGIIVWITGKSAIFILVRALKFALRMYNFVKP